MKFITLLLRLVEMKLILTNLYAVLMIICFGCNHYSLNCFIYCWAACEFHHWTNKVLFCITNHILKSN